MADYHRLKTRLKRTPYLVVDGPNDDASLVNETKALGLLRGAGQFPSSLVMNAAHALEGFAGVAGEGDREFRLSEIASIAGLSYQLGYHYLKRGVIVPSVRPAGGSGRGEVEARFSWRDAFIAGVVGSLRRHGLGLDTLKKVSRLFAVRKRTRGMREKVTTKSSTRPRKHAGMSRGTRARGRPSSYRSLR